MHEQIKGNSARRNPSKFGEGAKMTSFPLTGLYMESVQQEAFRKVYVGSLGRPALKIPKIYDMERTNLGDGAESMRLIRGEDCERVRGVSDG